MVKKNDPDPSGLIVHLQTDPGFPIPAATLLAKKTVPEKTAIRF